MQIMHHANEFGDMAELPSKGQQKFVTDHLCHPVLSTKTFRERESNAIDTVPHAQQCTENKYDNDLDNDNG